MLEIHGAVLLFGLAGLFGKLVLLSPMLIVLGRTVFAALTLGIVFLVLGRSLQVHSKTHLLLFLLFGLLLAVHWSTFFHAIQISTVAVGLLAFSTFPVFVTFLEPWFFNEKLRLFDVFTAGAVFTGLAVVVPSLHACDHITQGTFWGILSGMTFAVLSLFNRKYVRIYPSSLMAFYQNAFAGFFLLPFLMAGRSPVRGKDIVLLAFLGIFCTALAHGLFIRGLRQVRAQLASITACLEPVYGTLFAALLLGELPKPRTIIGGIMIIGTLVIATLKTKPDAGSVEAPV